jgi:hypothetical protein
VAQVNQNGFNMRVYTKFTADEKASNPDSFLFELCTYIANQLNTNNPELQSNQQVSVKRETFVDALDAVWSNVLGEEQQSMALLRQLNENVNTSFGPANLEICHTYWRQGHFPLEVARALGLPNNKVEGHEQNENNENNEQEIKDDEILSESRVSKASETDHLVIHV